LGGALTPAFRDAREDDALTLAALATQVFFDTYATEGITPALAREAAALYGPDAMAARLRDPAVHVIVATRGDALAAFIDLSAGTRCPVAEFGGLEVFRLYVQRPFQRHGLGRALVARAEALAHQRGHASLWLTAWAGNHGALVFYRSTGWRDVGATAYVIEGQSFENRVLVKRLAAPA
jgi:diamine N-acetyltransferase